MRKIYPAQAGSKITVTDQFLVNLSVLTQTYATVISVIVTLDGHTELMPTTVFKSPYTDISRLNSSFYCLMYGSL